MRVTIGGIGSFIQVVLSKFVRQMGELLPSTLYISYLRMLKGLANGPQCAHYCFSLLKTNGTTHSTKILFIFTVTLFKCAIFFIDLFLIAPDVTLKLDHT